MKNFVSGLVFALIALSIYILVTGIILDIFLQKGG